MQTSIAFTIANRYKQFRYRDVFSSFVKIAIYYLYTDNIWLKIWNKLWLYSIGLSKLFNCNLVRYYENQVLISKKCQWSWKDLEYQTFRELSFYHHQMHILKLFVTLLSLFPIFCSNGNDYIFDLSKTPYIFPTSFVIQTPISIFGLFYTPSISVLYK